MRITITGLDHLSHSNDDILPVCSFYFCFPAHNFAFCSLWTAIVIIVLFWDFFVSFFFFVCLGFFCALSVNLIMPVGKTGIYMYVIDCGFKINFKKDLKLKRCRKLYCLMHIIKNLFFSLISNVTIKIKNISVINMRTF